MRIRVSLIFFSIPLFILFSCSPKKETPGERFLLTNTVDRYRTDAGITIPRDSLEAAEKGLLPIARKIDGTVLPGQADDLDGDGNWDELAFLCSFQPNETISVEIDWVKANDYPKFKDRITCRFNPAPGTSGSLSPVRNFMPYRMNGIRWENDKIAFSRSFGGNNSPLRPDSAGILSDDRTGDTYQLKEGKDRDILNIALSTATGEPVLLNDTSVIPLSPLPGAGIGHTDSVTYTPIASGAARTVFTVSFYGWNNGKNRVNLFQTITMWAGRSGYESNVTVSSLPAGYALAVSMTAPDKPEGIFRRYEYGFVSLMTQALVSYNKKYYAGIALIIPIRNFITTGNAELPERNKTLPLWLAVLKPDDRSRFTFYTYGGWERENAGYRSADYFEEFVDYETLYLANPIRIQKIIK